DDLVTGVQTCALPILKRLASGANPAELQLGHEVSVEASAALLSHLDSRWYAPPKKTGNETQTSLDLCVGGLGAAYFRVAGRTFRSEERRVGKGGRCRE